MESTPRRQLTRKQAKAFAVAQKAARQVVRRRFRLLRLVRDAYLKLSRHEGPMSGVREDLAALMRLTRAWATREYREVPWRVITYAAAALVYFVNPADLIPDILMGLGFVDDAAVVAAVVAVVHRELEAFRTWEAGGAPPEDPQAASE